MPIYIKGDRVRFRLSDGYFYELPPEHGIIHNPEGEIFNRCDVFFGPYKPTGEEGQSTKASRSYFGSGYKPRIAEVDIPNGGWRYIGDVVQIFYFRPAGGRPGKYKGNYQHPYQDTLKTPLELHRSKDYVRLSLPDGCVLDDRGFVNP